MRRLFFISAIFISSILTIYSLPSFGLTLYSTQQTAQDHCPNDMVVWLNLGSGIWHTQGQRWYGATKNGAYVCREEAAAAGDRASNRG